MKLVKTFEKQMMNFFFKKMFFYFLLILIPLLVTSFGFIVYTNHTVGNEAMRMNESALGQTKSICDTIFRQSKLLNVSISIKTEVQMLMTPSHGSVDINKLVNDLRSYIQIYDYIHSVDILNPRLGFVITKSGQYYYKNISEVDWAKNIDYSNPNVGIISYIKKDIYPYLFGIIKTVILKKDDAQGAIAILLDLSVINDIIDSSQTNKNKAFYILDNNYNIISAKYLSKYYGSNIFTVLGIEPPKIGDKRIISMIKNGEVVSLTRSDQFDLYYLTVDSLDYSQNWSEDTKKITILVFITAFFLSVIVSFLITYKSVSFINSLVTSVKNPFSSKMVKKDLQFIVNSILMGSTNPEFETELDFRVFLLRQNQANSLLAQMNPHFLHNTLDTINWMAFMDLGGQNRVSAALVTLSDLLGYCLYGENFTCTLGEEIKHAKVYIDLLKMRYKEKFSVDFDIAADLDDYMVVRFLLQPLIENSVHHGIKPLNREGHIQVNAIHTENSIIIMVSDNGAGISAEKAEEINRRFDTNTHIQSLNIKIRETMLGRQQKKGSAINNLANHGIGIENIDMRIKLIFGSQYGVSIAPREGGGTCVTVRLPAYSNE
ncbi:MAG: hypothetical protein FIA99_14395 [Ruminiclostridium sp.]|nr:hypothetical protein [Ruminiclostridium sp.]